MRRRAFVAGSLIAAPSVAATANAPAEGGGRQIAVLAELTFPPANAPRAAAILAVLSAATREEPGCRRYVVAQDLETPGRFHLSELWDDRAALANHFRTEHMTAFLGAGRELAYSTTFLKQIEIAHIGDLDTRALRDSTA